MGKSPAKWVKNIILGKKSSKSHPSKKAADEKATHVSVQASSRELNATSTVSKFASHTTTTEVSSEVEQTRSVSATYENDVPVAANQVSNEVSAIGFKLSNEAENLGLEEAATEVQTALRSFMAYDSLKALISLQGLVRGHLVRRQAVATLRCVRGIVKLQAVVRGRSIRRSATGLVVNKKCPFQEADVNESCRSSSSNFHGKQSSNAFASKILASSVSALPLNLQYNPDESNSASKWLERWSSSHFWGSVAHPKVALGSNPQQQGNQAAAAESNMQNSLLHPTFEYGKPTRNNGKHSSQAESVQDHPENELERVKRNLRKISLNNKEAPGKSEHVVEMSKQSTRCISNSEHVLSDFIEDEIDPSGRQTQKLEKEAECEPLTVHEPVDLSHVGKFSLMNEEQVSKDEKSVENDHKSERRSLPAKQEYSENASKNTRTLPSYMQATESAKAKLRGLGSPRFAQEGEEDAVFRRHSLPSSTDGKLSTVSPRVQKVVAHANGKDRSRSDRSLTSSKDGYGKALRPEWRR